MTTDSHQRPVLGTGNSKACRLLKYVTWVSTSNPDEGQCLRSYSALTRAGPNIGVQKPALKVQGLLKTPISLVAWLKTPKCVRWLMSAAESRDGREYHLDRCQLFPGAVVLDVQQISPITIGIAKILLNKSPNNEGLEDEKCTWKIYELSQNMSGKSGQASHPWINKISPNSGVQALLKARAAQCYLQRNIAQTTLP
ncbi:predicted protein [Histoplasma capsulatum G186AR]|uniref:Uncharacterized protein n=1 Tax=Ajellomyces capsulatus (strain G186AR / H82 / ATCC MYA-2454 / RMSCC 2432) TaxID=447093 RepID=C0NQ10_AJECG|nr:uncharacterized protein HCBG_05240 [Histoplasma capsulatum G186AR]EEH07020.1 predicted protein [Histoplasma capsulatum G186AR]